MKIEIAIEGPVQAMSELLGRPARMSPTLERFRDPFEGDEEKARIILARGGGPPWPLQRRTESEDCSGGLAGHPRLDIISLDMEEVIEDISMKKNQVIFRILDQ